MRCSFCEWRCELDENTFGVCRMYHVERGTIRERYPHKWCTYTVSRIESVPFYHAYPGSRALAVGTFGCNFHCSYCSNGFIARQDPSSFQDRMFHLTPETLVDMAHKLGCSSIVFNVNEPTVSLPTLMKVHDHAAMSGIPMGCLTNGYMTEESIELFAKVFSFTNISLKGFSDGFYRDYLGIPAIDPVLRNIRRLAKICHVEVATPVIPEANDGQLDAMARFLAGVDTRIPWHVFRLLPEHDMKEEQYPSIEGINNALSSARDMLDHVYFHNFIGSDWVNTLCPRCGDILIERFSLGCGGDRLKSAQCDNNRCRACGYQIPLLGTIFSRKESEAA